MYISVIALAVASVSMSVAWFATSSHLYVNSINITIDTDRELQISQSREDGYVEHIEHTEVEATGAFMPITSAHSSLWTSQMKDSPIFYDESNASDYEGHITYTEVREGYGYFSQKFYLLADDDLYITIDPDKTFIKANEEYNSSYAEYLYEYYQRSDDEHYARYKDYSVEELNERLNRIVNAMRFSILIKDGEEYSYSIIDPNYDEETILGGLLDNEMDQYYDGYYKTETDEWYERVYGEVIGEPVYDEPLAQDSGFLYPNEAPNAFNARHKKGRKTFNLEKSLANGFEIAKEGAYRLDDFRGNTPKFYFPVYMDVPKEVVISIYIEGWDLDSVNYTMGAAFLSDLTFKIYREM